MKNILIINPWAGNIGPNTFLKNFFRNIQPYNVKLTIVYPEKDLISKEMEEMGLTVIYNKWIGLRHVKSFYLKTLLRFGVEIYLVFFYLKLFLRNRFDSCLVNTEIYSFSLLSLWAFSNVYVVVHSLSFKHNGLLNKALLFFQKMFVKKYLAVSNTVKESLKEQGVVDRVEVAYNGVEIPTEPVDAETSSVFQILTIAHPVPHKGAHHLIEVLKFLKGRFNFKWTILGWYSKSSDKDYENYFIDQIEHLELNNQIELLGNVDHIEEWYKQVDLLVHPSESESFGFAIAEAMSYRIPVVAFHVGALPELIDHNVNGILIPPFDKMLMAENIEKLFNDPDLRRKMGISARIKIQENFELKNNMLIVYKILGLEKLT